MEIAAQVGLLLVSFALGAVFVRFDVGFSGAFRNWLGAGDGRALAACFAIPAVAALVILPVGAGAFGYGRAVAPINTSLIIGAALFGIGMQIANGCGSGCLVAAGQGSRRMLIALPFFCLGGVGGSLLLPLAETLPGLGVIDLVDSFGRWGALLATELLLLASALLVARGVRPDRRQLGAASLIGALAASWFLVAGQAWGITMGLTVIGAKSVQALGLDIAATDAWSVDWLRALLAGPITAMPSALSDIGVLIGAFAAAALLGKLRHRTKIGLPGAIGAMLGGLAMGVGARLSYGCNIGAFVSGAASGSLHGIIWFVAVLPGCAAGLKLRRFAGLG